MGKQGCLQFQEAMIQITLERCVGKGMLIRQIPDRLSLVILGTRIPLRRKDILHDFCHPDFFPDLVPEFLASHIITIILNKSSKPCSLAGST